MLRNGGTEGEMGRLQDGSRALGMTVVGRFVSPSGEFHDASLGGTRLAKLISGLPASAGSEGFWNAAGRLLAADRLPGDRLVIMTALSLGRLPFEAGDASWWKSDFDDDKHPRWPAGTPESQGGRFRPRDDAADGNGGTQAKTREEIIEAARRLALRRTIRGGLLASAARIVAELVGDMIPGIDVISGAATLADLAHLASEYYDLHVATNAAIAFVEHGPYDLGELRVSPEDRRFPSYGAFYKSDAEKYYQRAGNGYQYHHIVEDSGENEKNMPAEQLQNTENIIRLPTLIHEAVSAKYSSLKPGENMTWREWLQTQPYEVQRAQGLKFLRELGVLKTNPGESDHD